MSERRYLTRDEILSQKMEPIEVTVEPDLHLRLRALTAADADYLTGLHRKHIGPRDKIARMIHHQLQDADLTEKDIGSWDDGQILSVFRVWAVNKNTLDSVLAPEAGFDEAVAAMDVFAREWSKGFDALNLAPVMAVAKTARRSELDRLVHSHSLGNLARQVREMEQMSRRSWDPAVISGIIRGMEGADLARRFDLPLSLGHQLAELRSPPRSAWSGINLGEQLGALHKALSTFDGVDSIRALSMTRTTILAESALAGVDLASLSRRLTVTGFRTEVLTDAVRVHLQAYGNLVEGLSQSVPKLDVRLAYEIPSIEAFNEAEMASVLIGAVEGEDEAADERRQRSDEIADELDVELPDLLIALDPNLVRLWEGARQARRGDNVDRSRHVGVSLRTLFDDVLNHIAPEKQVKQWCGPEDLRDNGQVKREARFRYIGRNLEYRRVKTAFEADMNALVAAYGVLNGLHEGSLDLSPRDLALVILRIESALRWAIIASQES